MDSNAIRSTRLKSSILQFKKFVHVPKTTTQRSNIVLNGGFVENVKYYYYYYLKMNIRKTVKTPFHKPDTRPLDLNFKPYFYTIL